jgi:hypothetical protein
LWPLLLWRWRWRIGLLKQLALLLLDNRTLLECRLHLSGNAVICRWFGLVVLT